MVNSIIFNSNPKKAFIWLKKICVMFQSIEIKCIKHKMYVLKFVGVHT